MRIKINHFQVQAGCKFLYQFLKTTDTMNKLMSLLFTIVLQPEQGQIWHYFEAQGSELSDKVLCLRAAINESHGSCSTKFHGHFLFV